MSNRYEAWAARWRVPLGFVAGIIFLALSRPVWTRLIMGEIIALIGLVLRGLAAGRLEKNLRLATSGLYSLTRNPLYLGSFLLAVGLAMAGGYLPLGIALVALFLVIYLPVMRREESFLRQKFGKEFEDYSARVPLFLPRIGSVKSGTFRFDWTGYRKNREYEAALGFAVISLILILKIVL
ncbi:MAG TPA: isoprenylcysteine carboxylmethyltransferase family protein [Terriglobia bacterium]|nr:isoprenylcysteine carboxylmethyltransferase family protein [Terriglobia bacterium]